MSGTKQTRKITTCGCLIGLAFVLSFISVIHLPYGGSVTLFSMVPIAVISCMYGIKTGFLCGFIFGILEAVSGACISQAFIGLGPASTAAMFALDYVVAYSVLGLAGIFYKKRKNVLAASAGTALAATCRFAAHFISGWILWGGYGKEWFSGMQNSFAGFILEHFSGNALAAVYSLCYNGLYMIPEILFSVIGAAVLFSVPAVKKQISD